MYNVHKLYKEALLQCRFKICFFHPISCHSLVYTPLCGDSKLLIPWRCQSLTFLSFVIYHLSVRNALTFFIQQTPIHTLIPRNITFLRIPSSTFSICAFIVIPDTLYYLLTYLHPPCIFIAPEGMPLNIWIHEKKDRWYLCVKFFLLSILPNLILGINLFRIFFKVMFPGLFSLWSLYFYV